MRDEKGNAYLISGRVCRELSDRSDLSDSSDNREIQGSRNTESASPDKKAKTKIFDTII